jgi:hypothetical protein
VVKACAWSVGVHMFWMMWRGGAYEMKEGSHVPLKCEFLSITWEGVHKLQRGK